MSERLELPKAHIKDLLRNNNEVLIASDAIEAVHEKINELKSRINREINSLMTTEARKIIQKEQISQILSKIGLATDVHFNELRLSKADMRRILEDPESDFMISNAAIIIMQHVIENFLRTSGENAFIYIQKHGRKTLNAESLTFAFKNIDSEILLTEKSRSGERKKTGLDQFINRDVLTNSNNEIPSSIQNENDLNIKTIKTNKLKATNNNSKNISKNSKNGAIGFEDKLWQAADKMRNNMDPALYKHVVLGLIFLKFISDAFEEKYQELQNIEYADPEEEDEYIAVKLFWVPKEARWTIIRNNSKKPEIGKILDDAMDVIEKKNPKLKGVLPKNYANPDLNKIMLGGLIDLISDISLGDKYSQSKDILGQVYEYFLGKFAMQEGKGGGQFFTPTSIVRLLVEMIEPYKGRVYDPCCGSGGMFVQSQDQVFYKPLIVL